MLPGLRECTLQHPDTHSRTKPPLYLGVDGGGTGCRARIETGEGVVLGRGAAGPATTRIGIGKAWAAIETAWRAAFAEAALAKADLAHIHAGLGIAGMTRSGSREAFEALPHPFASIHFASDATAACIGAHNGADGGIVIVGTGSCGVARVKDKEFKIGGWGFPASDEGSGADLGLRAVRMALFAYDGRTASTPLLRDILKRFDERPENVVAWMDQATATDYATFAPMVARHADEGEPSARHLMQEAAARIEDICRALIAHGAPRIALIGGLSAVMESWLPPDLRHRIATPIGDAVDGAAMLAGRAPKKTSDARHEAS